MKRTYKAEPYRRKWAVICLDYVLNRRFVMATGLTQPQAQARVNHLCAWFRKRFPKGELITP